jgi:hypothetical protein
LLLLLLLLLLPLLLYLLLLLCWMQVAAKLHQDPYSMQQQLQQRVLLPVADQDICAALVRDEGSCKENTASSKWAQCFAAKPQGPAPP